MKWTLSLGLWLPWTELMAEPLRYTLAWDMPPRYTYKIRLECRPSPGRYTEVALPAWRPGRYLLQNYAGAVSHFAAYDEAGEPLRWRKITKDTWQVENPRKGLLRVEYRFYARQLDAGSSYLSPELVYFNPVNLLVYVPGRLGEPCELHLPALPEGWRVATALPRVGPRKFVAADYHHLVDSPFLIAPFLHTDRLDCEGVTLYVHFWGRVGARSLRPFLQDLCRIFQVQKRIWGHVPFTEYHFMYLLVPFSMRHAVEHAYCAMFVLPEEGASSEVALRSFLGISAHELFHVWNVKRLRPAALWPYRYDREAYTSLHWLTEGVTDYYTSLSLLRAGLIESAEYWQRLSAELTQIENTPAYTLFSPAELSIDSWLATSSYRPPLYQGSFYAAGKRVGFLLDMTLRRETRGQVTLDSLLRYLYQHYYLRGKGLPEEAVEEAAVRLGGAALKSFFDRYVEGREAPDYGTLLSGLPLRVSVEQKPYSGWGRMGILRYRLQEEGIRIEEVIPGSASEKAGLEAGDLLLTVEGRAAKDLSSEFWDSLNEGVFLRLGWTREGFPLEGTLSLISARQKQIRIEPLERDFLKSY